MNRRVFIQSLLALVGVAASGLPKFVPRKKYELVTAPRGAWKMDQILVGVEGVPSEQSDVLHIDVRYTGGDPQLLRFALNKRATFRWQAGCGNEIHVPKNASINIRAIPPTPDLICIIQGVDCATGRGITYVNGVLVENIT